MRKILMYIDSLNRVYRLVISLVAGLIVFFVFYGHHPIAVTFMAAWITFAVTTLFIVWSTILLFHPREISTVANSQDTTRVMMFFFVIAAACISLVAIVLLLKAAPDEGHTDRHILLSAISVFCSWMLIHTVFTLRYAHLYYTYPSRQHLEEGEEPHGGLQFPCGTKHPDFLDFVYFSFVLGMAFQTSDVSITSRKIRHLALLHSFIAFVYNTIIVALSINIVSGMIAGDGK